MSLEDLLRKKNQRLSTVPDAFLTELQKVQRQMLTEILEILSGLDRDSSGAFKVSKANVAKVAEVDVLLREALERSDYTEAVTEFAKEFNNQVAFNDDYFKAAFPEFTKTEIGTQLVKSAQRSAVELLVNTSPDADFIAPVKGVIERAVVNGASFKETLAELQSLITGDEETDGKIVQYSKQIAHDTFALSDAAYSAAAADEVGAEWYKWSGSEIKTTRPFCAERDNEFFHRKEIEAWGAGRKTEGKQWPQSGTWAGMMEGTNEATIFSTRGGYNCRHSVMAVSVFAVPKSDVERAIRLGYYEPSEKELELLEL